MAETDFDGCSRACRALGFHTNKWGACEHAVEPEPHLSVARHVIAGDGWPSIAMESIPLAELAARIESALRSAPVGEYDAMALAAAKSLIDASAPHSPAPAPSPVSAATGEHDVTGEAEDA